MELLTMWEDVRDAHCANTGQHIIAHGKDFFPFAAIVSDMGDEVYHRGKRCRKPIHTSSGPNPGPGYGWGHYTREELTGEAWNKAHWNWFDEKGKLLPYVTIMSHKK